MSILASSTLRIPRDADGWRRRPLSITPEGRQRLAILLAQLRDAEGGDRRFFERLAQELYGEPSR
ncbi:MAG: hypothetical protein QME77_13405 [bacterium]|nr:hypothetical protein [bacterium]